MAAKIVSVPKDVAGNVAADNKLDAMDRVDERLDFASAILTLIVASEDDPPAFSRLNSTLQIQIIDGVRTLIEDARIAADTAYNQTVRS